MTWVNAVVQGILLGGFYALLACGLSLMFGVMRIINLAHGDIAVLGAYLITVVLDHGTSRRSSRFVAVLPVMLALGYVLQRTILERSLRSGVLVPLLTTFGLSIVIQNLLLRQFSPDVRSLGGERRLDHHRELADHEPALDLGDRRAHARRRGRACSAACSSSCRRPASGARCGRPRRTPTRPSSSASTRARSTRGRPRSPSPSRRSAALFLAHPLDVRPVPPARRS